MYLSYDCLQSPASPGITTEHAQVDHAQKQQITRQQDQIMQQQQKIQELQQTLMAINFDGKLANPHPGVMLVPVYDGLPMSAATPVSLIHASSHMTSPLVAGAGTTSLYPSPPGGLPAQVNERSLQQSCNCIVSVTA